MDDATETRLQAKVFDFALAQLVCEHRQSFQPLWTVDSWVKFLIWMSLNCGLSGEQESLELFAKSLGSGLTIRMRRLFFERVLENLELHVMADPADSNVLIMPISGSQSVLPDQAAMALDQVGLLDKVVSDQSSWKVLDALIAVPWETKAMGS